MSPQVPAARPLGMLQTPVQQSVPRTHTSPVEPQLEARAQTWFSQLSEQQSPAALQALPRVVQLPATTATHLLPAQLPEQHCAADVQEAPF
jgi:hypothetical protein